MNRPSKSEARFRLDTATVTKPLAHDMTFEAFTRTPGLTVWITGLSGAGKSSIARALVEKWQSEREAAILIDGDAVRAINDYDLGHSPADRIKNAYRVSRLCQFLNQQGFNVVCATMSLYPEIWDWNRENLPRYIQVYVKAEMESLLKRDSKGVYSKNEDHVVGVHLDFTEPTNNDLELDTTEDNPSFANELADEILGFIHTRSK